MVQMLAGEKQVFVLCSKFGFHSKQIAVLSYSYFGKCDTYTRLALNIFLLVWYARANEHTITCWDKFYVALYFHGWHTQEKRQRYVDYSRILTDKHSWAREIRLKLIVRATTLPLPIAWLPALVDIWNVNVYLCVNEYVASICVIIYSMLRRWVECITFCAVISYSESEKPLQEKRPNSSLSINWNCRHIRIFSFLHKMSLSVLIMREWWICSICDDESVWYELKR